MDESAELTALGAEVLWVRRTTAPLTPKRPDDLHFAARAELELRGVVEPIIASAATVVIGLMCLSVLA